MDDAGFLDAVAAGAAAIPPDCDLLCLGEMGIGNTTAAAALAAALFGGGAARWVGRGTGVDDAGLARKRAAVEAGLARHAAALDDPLAAAAALGGRELAAILGATLAARQRRIPVRAGRLRLHRRRGAARAAGARRPRSRGARPCLGRSGAPGAGRGAGACAAARSWDAARRGVGGGARRASAACGAGLPRRDGDLRECRRVRTGTRDRRAASSPHCMLLTRLPVGRLRAAPLSRGRLGVPAGRRSGRRLAGAAFWAARALALPVPLASVWCLAALVLATGGLHEDAAADTADAFGARATPARRLEIMRDSRIGSFGALALLLTLAIRGAAIAAIGRPAAVAAALAASGAVARAAMLGPLLWLRPARPDGLAASLGRPSPATIAAALGIAALAAFALLPPGRRAARWRSAPRSRSGSRRWRGGWWAATPATCSAPASRRRSARSSACWRRRWRDDARDRSRGTSTFARATARGPTCAYSTMPGRPWSARCA